jgi:hypothetical protein
MNAPNWASNQKDKRIIYNIHPVHYEPGVCLPIFFPHPYPLHKNGEGKGNHYLVFFSIFFKIWFKTLSQLPVTSEFQNRITSTPSSERAVLR